MVTLKINPKCRHSDVVLAVLRAAHADGLDKLVGMILHGTARVYTRTPKSRPGWQVADWDRPVPEGTRTVVLVDAYETPATLGLPAEGLPGHHRRKDRPPRPHSPESRHTVVTRSDVSERMGHWREAS